MPDTYSDTDAALNKAGLESIGPRDEDMAPMIVREGDRVWLSVVHNRSRVNLCEISVARLTLLNKQAAEAVAAIVMR